MRFRSRSLRILAVAALAAGGLTAGGSATTATAAAASCYGSAKTISSTDDNGRWPITGYVYATSACNDINVKVTGQNTVETCFVPSSGSVYCNGGHDVYANTWGVAATDVKDGTKFYLKFWSGNAHGVAAY
ncbi:hypothetical protein PV703_18025 [Streptomyces sp. ME01-24h]|nr:hypothetical protein [Streptomyces sp. ME19-03-3]MDX3355172.1 hypothetical protein [Streptomyces sp. ME01-24h]